MKTLSKRATIYFDKDIHRTLKVKAAETDSTVSDLVNNAVRDSLHEDYKDLKAFEDRVHEPSVPYEKFLKDLKARGKI